MAYERGKDKVLFEKAADCGMFNIVVAVYSYDGGVPKLQLSRQKLQELGEPMWQKLGRISLAELNEILPLVDEAKKFMTVKDKGDGSD